MKQPWVYMCSPSRSPLTLHPLPLGLPSAPGPSACLMHPTWAGDLFHPTQHVSWLLVHYGNFFSALHLSFPLLHPTLRLSDNTDSPPWLGHPLASWLSPSRSPSPDPVSALQGLALKTVWMPCPHPADTGCLPIWIQLYAMKTNCFPTTWTCIEDIFPSCLLYP